MTLRIQQWSVDELITMHLKEKQNGIEKILDLFKNTVIVKALQMTEGNVTQAAVLLKTHRNNLIRWIHESGIDRHYPDRGEGL